MSLKKNNDGCFIKIMSVCHAKKEYKEEHNKSSPILETNMLTSPELSCKVPF